MIPLEQMPPRYPTNGTFELTLRCNLHCKMCMLRHSDSENPRLLEKELTAGQWIDLAKQVFDAGTLGLLLTGGEPMVRKDFCEIYRGIYETGFLITLYTNATLVTPEIMALLRQYPPHRIGVTLYGASNETYAAVCGCADGFDRAMAGIAQLKTLPSVLDFRMTLIRDSASDAEKIIELVKQRFGANVTQTGTVFQSVRGGCAQASQCRLTPEENLEMTIGRLVEKIKAKIPAELKDGLQLRLQDVKEECAPEQFRYSLLGCSAGMDSYTISWDGRLLGCQMLGNFYTDTISQGFARAWEQFPYTVHLPRENPQCAACELHSLCPVCPAVRMAECKDLSGVPQYICSMTKLLQEKKGETL